MKTINPRRAELRELSAAIQPLVKAGLFDSVNEGLIEEYSRQVNCAEWHTFKDWKTAGKCVRKGEQGFPIWGRPRTTKPADGSPAGDLATLGAMLGADPQGPQFFPVCYLFHAGQVDTTTTATESAEIHA